MSAAPAVSPRHLDGPGSPHLSLGGYFCPQCHAKYTELPVECKVCGKSDQSGCLLPAGSQQTLQPSASCALSSRLDSGVGPPPGQVLSPPLPPSSLYRESSSTGQVTLTHLQKHPPRCLASLLTRAAVFTGAARLVRGG